MGCIWGYHMRILITIIWDKYGDMGYHTMMWEYHMGISYEIPKTVGISLGCGNMEKKKVSFTRKCIIW